MSLRHTITLTCLYHVPPAIERKRDRMAWARARRNHNYTITRGLNLSAFTKPRNTPVKDFIDALYSAVRCAVFHSPKPLSAEKVFCALSRGSSKNTEAYTHGSGPLCRSHHSIIPYHCFGRQRLLYRSHLKPLSPPLAISS